MDDFDLNSAEAELRDLMSGYRGSGDRDSKQESGCSRGFSPETPTNAEYMGWLPENFLIQFNQIIQPEIRTILSSESENQDAVLQQKLVGMDHLQLALLSVKALNMLEDIRKTKERKPGLSDSASRRYSSSSATAMEALRNINRVRVTGKINLAGSMYTSGSIRSMAMPPVQESHKLAKTTDNEGFKVINRYTILADLGRGAYGKVKLGVDNDTDKQVAIKIINKNILKKSSDPNALNREIAIMKKLRHKNVVSLYEVIDDPSSQKLYMVMQYVANGPVVRVKDDFTCKPLPQETVRKYVRQLVSGLRYLHKRNVVHHDIKPDNILLGSDGVVYFSDFGVSEMATVKNKNNKTAGTPIFQAPEEMKGTNCNGQQTDTWALGVTLYMMLVGCAPFVGKNFTEVADSVIQTNFPWNEKNSLNESLNPKWKVILDGLLDKNPMRRWTLSHLKNYLDENMSDGAGVLDFDITDADVSDATKQCKMFEQQVDEVRMVLSNQTKKLLKRFFERFRERMKQRTTGESLRISQTGSLPVIARMQSQLTPNNPANREPRPPPSMKSNVTENVTNRMLVNPVVVRTSARVRVINGKPTDYSPPTVGSMIKASSQNIQADNSKLPTIKGPNGKASTRAG